MLLACNSKSQICVDSMVKYNYCWLVISGLNFVFSGYMGDFGKGEIQET